MNKQNNILTNAEIEIAKGFLVDVQSTNRRKNPRFLISVFVCVLFSLLVLNGYFFMNSVSTSSFFTFWKNEFYPIERSEETKHLTTVQAGLQAYEQKDFEQSIKLLSLTPENDTAKLYAALSYKLLGNDEQALQLFSDVHTNGLDETALWYTSQIHLQKGETHEAMAILDYLSSYENNFTHSSQTLLTQL